MERIEITKSFSNSGSRNDVRMRVVNEFAKELPGYGNKDKASRYIYYVETLENGGRIYLQRPANLHNGFDFLVCVENINYAEGTGKRRRNYPKHTDIETDLVNKKNENLELYRKLYDLIDDVYNCKDISSEEISKLTFTTGYSAEHILKVLKWLFIEQDIRYWNYSGRAKTRGIIPTKD